MNASLLLGLALVIGAPAKEPPKKEEPSIVGEWFAESAVMAGMPAPKAPDMMKFNFTKDGELIVREGGNKDEAGKYTLDPKKKPMEMDLIPPARSKEMNILAIYKLEGDTLTICAARQGKRPTEFASTAENQCMLLVLKRAKKEKE